MNSDFYFFCDRDHPVRIPSDEQEQERATANSDSNQNIFSILDNNMFIAEGGVFINSFSIRSVNY